MANPIRCWENSKAKSSVYSLLREASRQEITLQCDQQSAGDAMGAQRMGTYIGAGWLLGNSKWDSGGDEGVS